jgi:hypothetical protein
VGRVLDQFGIEIDSFKRWGSDETAAKSSQKFTLKKCVKIK